MNEIKTKLPSDPTVVNEHDALSASHMTLQILSQAIGLSVKDILSLVRSEVVRRANEAKVETQLNAVRSAIELHDELQAFMQEVSCLRDREIHNRGYDLHFIG